MELVDSLPGCLYVMACLRSTDPARLHRGLKVASDLARLAQLCQRAEKAEFRMLAAEFAALLARSTGSSPHADEAARGASTRTCCDPSRG